MLGRRQWGRFRVRESKAPRNDAFGFSGIIRFDQGSTESRPTTADLPLGRLLLRREILDEVYELLFAHGLLQAHGHAGVL